MRLAVRDAANLLDVSEKTIYRWIAQQIIPAYMVKGQYRFNRAELLEWATSRRIGVSAELLDEPESTDAPLPGLTQALETGGIFYRVAGHDRDSALGAVAELMRLPDEVDRDFLRRGLIAREALGSTAVGEGIAIPHVRNPVVQHVPRPSITLCFLERGIDFGALDGQPVRALFTIVSPTTRAHLHLMSHMAYALRDPPFRDLIRREASRDEILDAARQKETSARDSGAPAASRPAQDTAVARRHVKRRPGSAAQRRGRRRSGAR
jgi:nitrogen PTS system EIIA component